MPGIVPAKAVDECERPIRVSAKFNPDFALAAAYGVNTGEKCAGRVKVFERSQNPVGKIQYFSLAALLNMVSRADMRVKLSVSKPQPRKAE